jgi:hypothetical protein
MVGIYEYIELSSMSFVLLLEKHLNKTSNKYNALIGQFWSTSSKLLLQSLQPEQELFLKNKN